MSALPFGIRLSGITDAIFPPRIFGLVINNRFMPFWRSCQAMEMPAGPPPMTAIRFAAKCRQFRNTGLDAGLTDLGGIHGNHFIDLPSYRPAYRDSGKDIRRPLPETAYTPSARSTASSTRPSRISRHRSCTGIPVGHAASQGPYIFDSPRHGTNRRISPVGNQWESGSIQMGQVTDQTARSQFLFPDFFVKGRHGSSCTFCMSWGVAPQSAATLPGRTGFPKVQAG